MISSAGTGSLKMALTFVGINDDDDKGSVLTLNKKPFTNKLGRKQETGQSDTMLKLIGKILCNLLTKKRTV